MRKLAFTLLGLALLFAGGVAFQLQRLDAGELRDALTGRASAALARPVSAERAELAWWPLPRLELANVRVGDASGGLELSVDELHVDLSLPGLAVGEVLLRSFHCVRPHLRLGGRSASLLSVGTSPVAGSPRSASRAGSPDGEQAFRLALTRIAVEDGRVEAGPWRLERVQAAGGLGVDLAVELEVEAEAPGLGRLREGVFSLSGLATGETEWSARGTLDELELAELARAAGFAAEIEGHGRLRVRAVGAGDRLTGGELELVVPAASLEARGFRLLGPLALSAALGGTWQLDLGEAELQLGDLLSKPAGEKLTLSARPDASLPPREVREIQIRSAALRLDASARFDENGARVRVDGARADFAAMRPWWRTPWHPIRGSLAVRGAEIAIPAGELRVDGAFESVALPSPAIAGAADAAPAAEPPAALVLDGSFAVRDGRVESDRLDVGVGGQWAEIRGYFDVPSQTFEAALLAEDLDVGRALAALAGEAVLEGRLDAAASVGGGLALDTWVGQGRFELADARIPQADFPWPVEALDPRVATGEEGRAFDSLAGRFFVVDGRLQLDELSFWHPYLSAHLHGDVALADGALDLAGELEISEELDAGLGGEGRRRSLPVRSVSGSVRDPRFDMDGDAVRATFRSYAESLRAGRRP
jgi:hypothetical protein